MFYLSGEFSSQHSCRINITTQKGTVLALSISFLFFLVLGTDPECFTTELHLQLPPPFFGILRQGLIKFSRLATNLEYSFLSLLSCQDYECVPQCLASFINFKKLFLSFREIKPVKKIALYISEQLKCYEGKYTLSFMVVT